MNTPLSMLQKQVRALPLEEGRTETGIPWISAYRFLGETVSMPEQDGPYLYLVLDGTVRLHTPSGILDYEAGQYSISKIDTPQSGIVLAGSERGDFLALAAAFSVHDVIGTALEMDGCRLRSILEGELGEAEMEYSDQAVVQGIASLFAARRKPVWSEFLGRNRMREVLYYLLCGSCGRQLLQSVTQVEQAGAIYEANSWIKENFRRTFTVEELAEDRNMSVSLFHQKFKRAVGMGPLQCQKRLRLTEARRLMLDEEKNVTETAAEVGYESLSQFIRDYRKMFGAAPKENVRGLRERLKK